MGFTGEVMGFGRSFGEAHLASPIGAGLRVGRTGLVFVPLKVRVEQSVGLFLKEYIELGFRLVAMRWTGDMPREARLRCDIIKKVYEESSNTVDL